MFRTRLAALTVICRGGHDELVNEGLVLSKPDAILEVDPLAADAEPRILAPHKGAVGAVAVDEQEARILIRDKFGVASSDRGVQNQDVTVLASADQK